MWNRKKHGESRAKTTLKRGFAYAFCLAGSELGLVWSASAWLGLAFCRWFLHPFSFFGSSLCRCRKPMERERERGRRSAENGRQTRLEIFARSQWGRERGPGKHVKEQLLKRIYRFIYVFVCAMWVHRYSQLARERKREGQTHFGKRPKQSEAEKRKQKSVSEGVRRGKLEPHFDAAISILKFKFQ